MKTFQRTTKGNKVHVRACIILIIYLLKNDSDNLGKLSMIKQLMKNISYTNFHIFSLIIMWCVYMYINVSNQFFLTLTPWSPPTPHPPFPLKSSVGMTCNPSQSNKIRQPCLTQLSHFLWAWNGDMNKWPFTSGLNKYIYKTHCTFLWVS